MSANGKLSSSELATIPGGQLSKPAAKAWNAFGRCCKATHGVVISVNDSYRPLGAPGDLARGHWSQWAAWERYQQGGNLAAYPGTSNHGLGLAVDCPSDTQSAIHQWGAPFGWSKGWSDAPSENWHFRYADEHATRSVITRWSEAQVNDPIGLGDTGPGVKALKALMRKKGFFPHPLSTFFGAPSVWWLKRFQKSRRLKPDGIAGPATWAALRAK
jgi:Putative peptidoglycan binding domain/D-alanyl-D-alanine carboxypeptidase